MFSHPQGHAVLPALVEPLCLTACPAPLCLRLPLIFAKITLGQLGLNHALRVCCYLL